MFHKNILKAAYSRDQPSCDHDLRSLALPVQGPVLDEYNYIDLRKNTRNRRIDHLVMKELPVLAKSKSNDSTQRDRWEKSLDQYILAKEKLQTRKASISSEFEFLRLNKINKYRKKKLVEAHSLPISIINSTDLHETYSFDLSETDHALTHSLKLKQRRRFSTDKDMTSDPPKKTGKAKEGQKQQERIMNSILQNYFKKKYINYPAKQPLRAKLGKYSSTILKKNKGKLNL